jgi:hypothetical protein
VIKCLVPLCIDFSLQLFSNCEVLLSSPLAFELTIWLEYCNVTWLNQLHVQGNQSHLFSELTYFSRLWLKVRFHTITTLGELGLGPPITTHIYTLLLHIATLVVEELDFSMIIPPIGASCGVETTDLLILVESLLKSNCLLQLLIIHA